MEVGGQVEIQQLCLFPVIFENYTASSTTGALFSTSSMVMCQDLRNVDNLGKSHRSIQYPILNRDRFYFIYQNVTKMKPCINALWKVFIRQSIKRNFQIIKILLAGTIKCFSNRHLRRKGITVY